MASNKEKIISEIEDTMDLYKIGSDMRGAYKRLLESLEKVPEEDVAKWAIANQNAINFYLNEDGQRPENLDQMERDSRQTT